MPDQSFTFLVGNPGELPKLYSPLEVRALIAEVTYLVMMREAAGHSRDHAEFDRYNWLYFELLEGI
jgi:hypothetical protein